jgi:hypothetical protein
VQSVSPESPCYYLEYAATNSTTISESKLALEPFNYELYESIKDDEDIIILVDSRFNEDFDRKLKGILFDLSEGTLTNKRQLRILSVHFNDPAQLKEFEDRCKIKLSYYTIFLIKNRYVEGLQPFNFDELM